MPKVGFKTGQDLRDERLPAKIEAKEPIEIPKRIANQLMAQELLNRAMEEGMNYITFFAPSEEATIAKLKEIRQLYLLCCRT